MENEKKIEKLFVASMVYDTPELIEPFVQYETFGQIDHHVVVTPEKRLVFSSTGEDGVAKYYDYKTGKEITLYDKTSSYSTKADPVSSICLSNPFASGTVGPANLLEDLSKLGNNNGLRYGFVVPFEDYIKNKFGKAYNVSNPKVASLLLFAMATNRATELSFDPAEAEQQLSSLVYGIDITNEKEKKQGR